MPPVVFNITTQGEKALIDQIRKLEGEIDKIANKKVKSPFAGMQAEVKSVMSSLIGPVGLAGAVMAVTSELKKAYEVMNQNKETARRQNIDVGTARSSALINLPTTFTGGIEAMDKMAEKISKESKLSLARVYDAMAGGLSAKGSADDAGFESAMILASKLESKTGGKVDSGSMVGSILDLIKATKVNSADANMGWLLQGGAASRIESLEGMTRMVPGVTAGLSQGISPEKSMEWQASIAEIVVDKTGEVTQTAWAEFMKTVNKEIIPKKTTNMKTGMKMGKKEVKFSRASANTFEGKVEEMQKAYAEADEDTKKDMISKMGGRGRTFAFTASMLANTETWQKSMKAAQENIRAPDESAAAETKTLFGKMESGKYGGAVEADLANKKAIEGMHDTDRATKGSIEAQAWDTYQQQMDAGGYYLMRDSRTRADVQSKMENKSLPEYLANYTREFSKGNDSMSKDMRALTASLDGFVQQIKALEKKEISKASPNSQEVE